MMVIREYVNEMEALVARSVLEAHHIPAVVLRDDAGGMLPSMHLLYPVRLAVRVGDATHALSILDAPFQGDAAGRGALAPLRVQQNDAAHGLAAVERALRPMGHLEAVAGTDTGAAEKNTVVGIRIVDADAVDDEQRLVRVGTT